MSRLPFGPDKDAIEAGRRAYARFRLPISESKGFGFARLPDGVRPVTGDLSFTAWGTSVASTLGRVGPEEEKAVSISCLILYALTFPFLPISLIRRL